MINYAAITQFEDFFSNIDVVLDQHQIALQNNVDRYLQLKDLFNRVNVSTDIEFQRLYSYFYGLNRALNPNQKKEYYSRMEEMKNTDQCINVLGMTVELKPILGKYHFSFCSKMANIINDELYPIYDRNVRNVFHRKNLGNGLNYWRNIYQDISDTYRHLENHPIIPAFRTQFNAHKMGYMKILDALFWTLGR